MGRRGLEPPEAEANGFTDRTATNYGVTYPKAPHTGFEPASPHGPTVFKTAPSPPGHTAFGVTGRNRTERFWIHIPEY